MMSFARILYTASALLLLAAGTGADTSAQEHCRRLHHVDADRDGTQYINNGCRLICNIHGQQYAHDLNEGQTCMVGQSGYVCHAGECVRSFNNLGHIDVEFISASLYSNANAYATACLMNSSQPVHLPIQDRRNCISCSSRVQPNTNYPVWNEVCTGTGNYLFVGDARVTIEVWNHFGQNQNDFLGGITLTIDQLLQHGDNHRAITMAMAGGKYPGQMTTRVTWTARN